MITVEITGADAVGAALDGMPAAVVKALQSKMRLLTMNLANYVRTNKLQGQVLHQRSGQLNRSIQELVEASGTEVTGKVFSAGDVKYAAIHEYGGTIPAHDVVARNAQALAFILNGKQVFAKSVHIPAVTMPERSFLRSSLAENREAIVAGIQEAVVEAARKSVA